MVSYSTAEKGKRVDLCVLRLIEEEDGLVRNGATINVVPSKVLILVVVEDGLVLRELWRSTLRLERS